MHHARSETEYRLVFKCLTDYGVAGGGGGRGGAVFSFEFDAALN